MEVTLFVNVVTELRILEIEHDLSTCDYWKFNQLILSKEFKWRFGCLMLVLIWWTDINGAHYFFRFYAYLVVKQKLQVSFSCCVWTVMRFRHKHYFGCVSCQLRRAVGYYLFCNISYLNETSCQKRWEKSWVSFQVEIWLTIWIENCSEFSSKLMTDNIYYDLIIGVTYECCLVYV